MTLGHRLYPVLTTLMALAFAFANGCGGSVENGSGGGAGGGGGPFAGGSGGSAQVDGGGGFAAMPAGGHSNVDAAPPGGYGGGPNCAGCPDYKLAAVIDMPHCCGPSGGCGSTVDSGVASLISLAPGCYEHDQPGTPDSTCPSHDFTNPLDGTPVSYPGCCRTQTGTCGYVVDLSSQAGPTFGCTEIDGSAGTSGQACGGTDPCMACMEAHCTPEMVACSNDPNCLALLSCVQACYDHPCIDDCNATHAAGQPAFNAVAQCVSTYCPECNY